MSGRRRVKIGIDPHAANVYTVGAFPLVGWEAE
jgi:hypothetical protein